MARLVMKFGGTSVADIEHIRNVARHVKREVDAGHEVAVVVSAAIGAERCDIYTDVDGVYTTDPRVVPRARRLDKITFEEMLEMASLGAKVMQVRSIEL